MKAAVINKWGTPDVFEITNIQSPSLANDQILIRVFASGINPVDWKQRQGNHKYILGSPFPIVLGYDICGKVVEIGADITRFEVGDIVFGDVDNKYGGALAEYAVGHEHCFAPKPENISIEEAAGVTLAALTAYQAFKYKAELKPGQTVLVNGATGGVGHMAVQIAKLMGAKVIAVSSSRNKTLIDKLKPDMFIDYSREDLMLSNAKADVFFDVAGKYTFPKVKHLLNSKGIYINTLPRPKILFHKLSQPFSNGKKVKTLLRKMNQEDLQQIREWLVEGKLFVEIDKVFMLEDIAEAHRYSEEGHTRGKNIVTIVSN